MTNRPTVQASANRLLESGLDPLVLRQELDNYLTIRYNKEVLTDLKSKPWIAEDCPTDYMLLFKGAENFLMGVRFAITLTDATLWDETKALFYGVLNAWRSEWKN